MKVRCRVVRSLAATLMAIAASAHAADQTLLGSQLQVKNPSTPDKRKIVVKAKESNSDDSIIGDPTTSGATFAITADGGTPSSQTFSLPAGVSAITQKPFWSGDATKGFKYKDPKGENGAVKSAQIKRANGVFQMKASIAGSIGPVSVVPPNPGTDGCALLEITDGDSYSVRFAGGSIVNLGATLFKLSKPTIESSCVIAATTTTTVGGTTSTNATSSTTTPSPTTTTSLVAGTSSTTSTTSSTTSTTVPCVDRPLFTDPVVVHTAVANRIGIYMRALSLPVGTVQIVPTGQPGPITSLSWSMVPDHPNRLTAIVPMGQAIGSYDLIVTDATACAATLAQAITVTGSSTITIMAVDPPFATTLAPTELTIRRDTNAAPPGNQPFTAQPRVLLFPSSPAPGDTALDLGFAVAVDDATVHAAVPKGAPVGTYDVVVIDPDGTAGLLPHGINVLSSAPPSVGAVIPTSIPALSGQTVTVQGSGFAASVIGLSCIDGFGTPLAAPPVSSAAVSCGGQVCTQQATIDGSGLPAGAVCILRVTNADGSYGDYSAIGVTSSSLSLNGSKPGTALSVPRRAPVGVAGEASAGRRFAYAIGGDNGSVASPFASVEFAPVDSFGNLGVWQLQKFALGTARTLASAVSLGRYVYVTGGANGTSAVSSAERAMILSPGEVPIVGVDDYVAAATGPDAGYWSYRVSATFSTSDPDNPGGESLASSMMVVKLPSLAGQKMRVVLVWTAPVDVIGQPLPNVNGYRIYRTALSNGTPGTEVLLGTVGGATSSFTDDGTLTPGAESPLPIGSTGAWKVLPSMGSNRVGAASVVGADPATPGTFYVYALLGLNQAAIPLTSYEYLPINVALNGRQTVGTWTTGVATSAAGRWQLGAWSVDAATAPTVSGTDVWVFLGGGVSATNTAVNKVEAGKIAAGGDLGTLSDTPTDFSTTHAGYGVLAGNGRLFTFGGANALPSTGATVATLSSPPTLAGVAWNNDGLLLAQARYLMGNATRGCFEFLIGGQTFAPADASTEVVVW